MTAQPLPTVTAFDWVPDFARGLVRDLKVRWAMEELGLPYDVEILPAFGERSADYLARQPFDQVPAFSDGELDLFESGAILLYLAQKHPGLLPADEALAWKSRCWLFAAYASVEPFITRLVIYDLFHADKAWAKEARVPAVAIIRQKLKRVADALGDEDWLAGTFSVADIAMVTTLENLRGTDLVAGQPALVRYMQRAKARPAFQRALDAQMADFTGSAPDGWDN